MKKKEVLGIILALLLLSILALPINSAKATTQDMSITWIQDTPSYKKASVVFTTKDGKFDALFEVNVSYHSPEIYNITVDLSRLGLGKYYVGYLNLSETLNDAPKMGAVTAFHVHFAANFVKLLQVLIAATIIAIVIVFIVELVVKVSSGDLLGFIQTLWKWLERLALLSLPLVFLQLLSDENDDGTVGLHFPYYPVDYVFNLISNNHYYVATDRNWWEILKMSYTLWIIYPWWGITWTWFEAKLYGTRITPRPVKPFPPIASFIWSPERPLANAAVTFNSTSFDPDGTLVDYHWWFGDGNESRESNLTHQYSQVGNFNVTLQVTDNDTLTDAISQNITVVPVVPSKLDIDPDTLNLGRKGKWITAYIEPPKGYNLSNIDVNSIRLNGTIPVDPSAPIGKGDYDNDTIPDITVKLNRTLVSEYIISEGIMRGNVTLTISGQFNDGTIFEGDDMIRVRMPGDVNMDGKVDGKDITVVAQAFGSYPTHPRWNYVTDENENNNIDGMDIALIAKNFGKKYP